MLCFAASILLSNLKRVVVVCAVYDSWILDNVLTSHDGCLFVASCSVNSDCCPSLGLHLLFLFSDGRSLFVGVLTVVWQGRRLRFMLDSSDIDVMV